MLSPSADVVANARQLSWNEVKGQKDECTASFVRSLISSRREFGITRVGTITRLDRVGVPVVQVARPQALCNCVSQGKGATLTQAITSAFMEAIETWAAERIPQSALSRYGASRLPDKLQRLFASCLIGRGSADWREAPLSWIQGWDLFTDKPLPVPAALVDTVYTLPSPHSHGFPRSTTGLAAGRTIGNAVLHAALEILERDAVARARHRPHFFDHHRIDLSSWPGSLASTLLTKLNRADLLAAAWRVPAAHGLPIYWCQVMEATEARELVPLPAQGFGCDLEHDTALAKALLEACQARLTAISGAREDITRSFYRSTYDRKELAEWRYLLQNPEHLLQPIAITEANSGRQPVEFVIDALKQAGAEAAIVVPLYHDSTRGIHAVRVVAPPLRHF
jgi:ribosomal protein S12 methylthiotransferase accessory factor